MSAFESPPRLRWRLIIGAAAAVTLFAIARVAFTPFYDTNDDAGMRLIAEGRFVPGGTPAATLLYISPLLGVLMVAAVKVAPGFPWYDAMLLSGELIAIAVSVSVLLRRPNMLTIGATLALLSSAWLTAFVRVQFTVVAGHLTVAGCLLIADLLLDPPATRRAMVLQAGAIAALAGFGGLVRWHIAVMVLAIAIPLAVPFAFAAPRGARRSALGAAALALALSFVALGAVRLVESVYYGAKPGWDTFREYTLVKAQLTEWAMTRPGEPTLTSVSGQVGWSPTDVTMLQSWLSSNTDLFDFDRLKRAQSLLQSQQPSFSWSAAVRDLRTSSPQSLAAVEVVAGPAIWLLILLVVGGLQWRRTVYALYAVAVVGGAILVVPLFFKTMPFRVLWPILTLLAAFIVRDLARAPRSASWIAAPLALLLCVAAWPVVAALGQQSAAQAEVSARVSQDVTAVNQDQRRTYIVQGSSFPFESYFQPGRPTPPAGRIDLLPLGAAAVTPLVQDYLRRQGITDLMLTFCTDDRYRMISPKCDLPFVEQFVWEHFQTSVRVSPDFSGQTFTTCRCVAASKP